MSDLLDVRTLSVAFGGLVAIRSATLAVHAGEIHALIGPNGAGKSTLVNCVTGYQRPTAGSIHVGGTRIGAMRPAAVARLGVARTFQTPQLFGRLTTRQNVEVACARSTARTHATSLLEALGLAARMEVPASDLPYGEQRLLEVARALVRSPLLLLVDEPAAGLASSEIALLAAMLRRYAAQHATGVLIIEHNMVLVRALADRISVLHHGTIIASGPPDAVLAHPEVVSAYLGTSDKADAP
jgi:branched-chain amino acid transport system ATP-binding protein